MNLDYRPVDGVVSKLSAYGFYLDNKPEWLSCDKKKVLSSPLFKSLKLGDRLSDIQYNMEGFVTSFSVHSPGLEVKSPLLTTVHDRPQVPDVKAHDILKGQCLNIALNACKFLDFKDQREKAISLARKLLEEIEFADYYKW